MKKCKGYMPRGARGMSSNRFLFVQFLHFLLPPFRSISVLISMYFLFLMVLMVPYGSLGFQKFTKGSLGFFRIPQVPYCSLGPVEVLSVLY